MKKVMKFVKGKKEEETPVKTVPVETKKIVNEKIDEVLREDDFISRDKTITKLHKAVWNENSDKLKSIIKTHDIDITDKLDRTALYFAVLKNNPNIVNLLLENSANQNIPDIDGITPFLKSVQLGYKQCAANLLNHGADIKKTDKDSNSCLHFAIMGKQIDMLSFLLEYNADCNVPNVNGEYPLHIAIQLQDKQMVEILLNYNSDINVVNNSGLTPLMLAEKQNNSNIIDLLENYSLKNSKDNNLFPDEISHKSSYENVNTPKIEVKSPKVESDSDTWNESPITTPSKKLKKPLTQVSKFFNDEIEITEEKSESDVSVKCSENTSPQSGIIPPPCKPLRSLEYLQSGLSIENRPVHLLTLGTVRTRHISMTESDHSKNNTPHRYSYQGDFQAASGDSFQKLPDISTADEKGDSINISIKSKLLSKLECDSTIQSDWGSNESLPLDELSIGGKKEKSTSSTSKNNSNNSNSGSIRDKSTDIFLQKQFSLLEDYEKNRDKRCSVSYEMDLLTVKVDENKNNSNSHLDDIDNLLEDNNRINTQLEKYAGQSDTLESGTKSKSLPRNCEPYNSYHKGSFSLPRTLESGKDPYREMRSYGYFKPRSHFSFSLKMLKGEKKSGFIDKLKSMFNKKSQIHLTEQHENGTWLYKKTDNEYYSTKAESFSGTESVKKIDALPTSKTLNHFPDLKDEVVTNDDPSCSNNEQNKVIEKKILSLNNMNDDNQLTQSSAVCDKTCCLSEEERKFKRISKSLYSVVVKDDGSFCEECEYVTQKLCEAEQSILSKEHLINLLQNQLENLKNWNIKSIDESQEIYFKYALAKQELDKLNHICEKFNDKLDVRRTERSPSINEELTKLKEEADKWKKQYDELLTKIHVENNLTKPGSSSKPNIVSGTTDEDKWRSIIQDEVSTAVNVLKENTQVVVSSLEKQNKKLETMIEKLQTDLELAADREEHLQKQLSTIKNNVIFSKLSEKVQDDAKLMMVNQTLQEELNDRISLFNILQKDYDDVLKKYEEDTNKSNTLSEELITVKEDYRALTRTLSNLSEEIAKIKENALLKNEELRQQVAEIAPNSNMTEFIVEITDFLERIEMNSESKSEQDVSEQVVELSNSVADVEKINKLNSDIELKILEVKSGKKIDMLTKTSDDLKVNNKESTEKIVSMQNELEMNKELILKQSLKISCLHTALECEKKQCDQLKCDLNNLQCANQEQRSSLKDISTENAELKSQILSETSVLQTLEEENLNLKSSLSDIQNLNSSLNIQLNKAMDTINEMKELMEDSQQRMNKFEKANEDLQHVIDILKQDGISEKRKAEYENRITNLIAENVSLTEQIKAEKDSVESLKQHIESLQFYHDNEMKSCTVRLDEVLAERNSIKSSLEIEIEKLSNSNKQLQDKLKIIETENNQLHHNILELNQEIGLLGEKLQSTDILQDTQKYVDALDAATKENQAMKSAMSVLHGILETKIGEQVESVSELIEAERRKTDDMQYEKNNVASSPVLVDKSKEYCLEQRVNSIKEKIDELVENVSREDNDEKYLSMPNLEMIPNQNESCACALTKSRLYSSRKSTSSDNLITEENDCKIKWEKQIKCIQKLRGELADVLCKISNQKTNCSNDCTIDSNAIYYTKKYRHLVNNLESDSNEIQISECCKKNQMEEEVGRLRKELYKQKVERMRDLEMSKHQRECEILNVQLKAQYIENKQKLLSDLATVQNALKEEMELKTKCDLLSKKVTANQEARKKKLKEISLISAQPSTSVVKKVVICEIPETSPPIHKPGYLKYPEKPVKPHALVMKVKKRINPSLETHRLSSTESVPDSSSDDEVKKKYLL